MRDDGPGLSACIFDVDGVLLASPHERAWREALTGFADPAGFTTAFYQSHVAGLPRAKGAAAALAGLGAPHGPAEVAAYAARKQAVLEALIAGGAVSAFPDALRIVRRLRRIGWPMAAASSSKNAEGMMRQVRLEDTVTLWDAFAAQVCGRGLPHSKPAPDIFLTAAAELGVAPARCVVAEDAPAGIQAARAGGMAALGIARWHDAASLAAAGADLVVTSFDDVSFDALASGTLRRAATGETA